METFRGRESMGQLSTMSMVEKVRVRLGWQVSGWTEIEGPPPPGEAAVTVPEVSPELAT